MVTFIRAVSFFLVLLALSSNAMAMGKAPTPVPPVKPTPTPPASPRENGAVYRARYSLGSATAKLVDNRGNGFEKLYGVRNFRAVLNGVYYRGGANNAYHRTMKRGNENPLPSDGLVNLCEEGFGTAVYLYSTNFSTAAKSTRCRTFENNENTLTYRQISALNGSSQVKSVLALIHDHIRNPRLGPIYAHCWNGWHASGLVGATALRQFCGFTAEQAVNYWNRNIDGAEIGDSVRNKIRQFTPYSEFQISAEDKKAICPSPASLQF